MPKTSANTSVGTKKGNMTFEFLIVLFELFVTQRTKITQYIPQNTNSASKSCDCNLLIGYSQGGTYAQNKGAAY